MTDKALLHLERLWSALAISLLVYTKGLEMLLSSCRSCIPGTEGSLECEQVQ